MSDAWRDLKKILCIRLDNLGDVLMSTPALRALRHALPRAEIVLLASPGGAAILPFLPDVDRGIVYDAPWVKNDDEAGPQADLAMIARLRDEQFDAAVIFTVYTQSALPAAMMCRLAGIPRVLAHVRENPYRLVTDRVKDGAPMDDGRHEVQRQLDLVASVGATAPDTRMAFAVRDADRASLRGKLATLGVDLDAGCVLVHPGATAASRRYPAEYFALAVRRLAARTGLPILLTGSAGEHALAESIRQGSLSRAINLAGQLSLGELGALIARAGVLVSNNSGPVHMAAALGTPVVDLYALTNPQHTPWRVPHRLLYQDVPCKWCYRSVCPEGHHACLRGVEPDAVVVAALALLRGEHAAPDAPAVRTPIQPVAVPVSCVTRPGPRTATAASRAAVATPSPPTTPLVRT